jgi:hypothetical protein
MTSAGARGGAKLFRAFNLHLLPITARLVICYGCRDRKYENEQHPPKQEAK